MKNNSYTYIIVGAGLAGASAAEGIREHDQNGPVLMIGSEKYLPYDRPPLSKGLWWGYQKTDEIFLHDLKYYEQKKVNVLTGTVIVSLDREKKTVSDAQGNTYRYEKLLLATGGVPRVLPVPGGDLREVCYYRYLSDYFALREKARPGAAVAVVGGGFIGSELAASLARNQVTVTMVFPEEYVCARVLPGYLGSAVQRSFMEHGVTIFNRDKPVSFAESDGRVITRTQKGHEIESDFVIAGIGIVPSMRLARSAELKTDRGIIVNEYQQTSDPDIFAAGDNAVFPYLALGREMRVEHWDHALNQGACAGRNMAGARQKYDRLPDFFSDMFEFSYQAVGEVDSRLATVPAWEEENRKGAIYYLRDNIVNGILMCNVPDKLEEARAIIKKRIAPENLQAVLK